MQKINYLNLIKSNWQTIAIATSVLVLLTVIICLFQPFEYSSKTGFLIFQKQTTNLDAYAAARASERLAANLANIIETDSFYNKVLNVGFKIDIDWPKKEDKLRKAWQKMIDIEVLPDSGIMTVIVYNKDKAQAKIVSQAIASVLINDSAGYYGGGSSVIIKMVNTPLVSNYPVKPNIILNVFSALIIGLIFSSGYVIYKEYKNINIQDEKIINQIDKEINQEVKSFNQEMATQYFPIKTMLSEPFGKKYYFEN